MLLVLLCGSHSFGADEDVARTLGLGGVTGLQEDQVLIVVVDITHCCYLVDWDPMQDILNVVTLGNYYH